MLTSDQALARILALMHTTGTESLPLRQAAGRVLAEPVTALRDQPPFPAASMDGYAIRTADARAGRRLTLIGTSRAGEGFKGTLAPGQAVRIFTGAPVPAGTEMVLIQEDAEVSEQEFTLRPNFGSETNIRPQGFDFKTGFSISAPRRLTPADLSLIAAMNHGTITVRKPPDIALIATGDELVVPGEARSAGQITASSNFGLAALLEAQGAQVRVLPIARDTPASLTGTLTLAHGADLIVTLGGASVGDHDLVRDVAATLGLSPDFWKVAVRPGKPLIAGKLGETPLIGLPGNPVSAFVCAHLFLRPAVDVMLGLPGLPLPRLTGKLTLPLPVNGNREHFLRGRASWGADGWQLEPFANQDSSLLSVLARANALIIAAPGQPEQPAGTLAPFILIG